jgi:SAM-dependent methyltransferase
MTSFQNGLAKLRWSLHHRGLLGTVSATARTLTHKHDPSGQQIIHPFDQQYGVDTSGFVTAVNLATGHPHDLLGTGYCGVAPSRFAAAVDRWLRTPPALPVSEYAFIDIGCGKGRALMLASQHPFREIIGVELNLGLAETARLNLDLWRTTQHPAMPMQALCQDATAFDFPAGPCLIFLYNPFAEPVLRKFLDNVDRSFSAHPRALDILYCNPTTNERVLAERPQYRRLWSEPISIAPEDVAANPSADSPETCSLYRPTV